MLYLAYDSLIVQSFFVFLINSGVIFIIKFIKEISNILLVGKLF